MKEGIVAAFTLKNFYSLSSIESFPLLSFLFFKMASTASTYPHFYRLSQLTRSHVRYLNSSLCSFKQNSIVLAAFTISFLLYQKSQKSQVKRHTFRG